MCECCGDCGGGGVTGRVCVWYLAAWMFVRVGVARGEVTVCTKHRKFSLSYFCKLIKKFRSYDANWTFFPNRISGRRRDEERLLPSSFLSPPLSLPPSTQATRHTHHIPAQHHYIRIPFQLVEGERVCVLLPPAAFLVERRQLSPMQRRLHVVCRMVAIVE